MRRRLPRHHKGSQGVLLDEKPLINERFRSRGCMQHVGHLIHDYGLLVVAGFIGLEALGLPLPGETALIVGSVIAGRTHELSIVAVILVAAGASVVGRAVGYMIGARFGYWLLLRYGSYLRITEARIKLGQYLFLRYGGKIIVFARFVPVLRALAGILAGANRMPWRQFLLANTAGAFAWAAFFGFAAYMFGRQIERIAGPMVIVIGIAAVIVIAVGANFAARHEAQLAEEAERALPGPLRWP